MLLVVLAVAGVDMAINTTVDDDRRFREITKRIIEVSNSSVTIGIHNDAGSYPNGEEIVNVAFWNEFGTESIPERSFIRSTIDENRNELRRMTVDFRDDVLGLRITTNKAMKRIGFMIQELIRAKIKELRDPPNVPSVAARKPGGRSDPLIDSQLLRRSIGFEVQK